MAKGVPNKKYTPEFKKLVVETMQEEHLGYCETAERFEIRHKRLNYPIPPINIIHRNIKEQFNPTVRPGIFLKVAYP